MITVREYLNKRIAESDVNRLKKLKEIRAPQIIIDDIIKQTELAKNGNIQFSGDQDALDLTFKSEEIRTGRGGRKYSVIYTEEGKIINYYPRAKYGRFIKFAK